MTFFSYINYTEIEYVIYYILHASYRENTKSFKSISESQNSVYIYRKEIFTIKDLNIYKANETSYTKISLKSQSSY